MNAPAFPAAWYAKFRDWPIRPGLVSLPRHDGDTAWLDHLAETIFEAKPSTLQCIPPDHIYRQTVDATWINAYQILDYWPLDMAAVLLDDWRRGR